MRYSRYIKSLGQVYCIPPDKFSSWEVGVGETFAEAHLDYISRNSPDNRSILGSYNSYRDFQELIQVYRKYENE